MGSRERRAGRSPQRRVVARSRSRGIVEERAPPAAEKAAQERHVAPQADDDDQAHWGGTIVDGVPRADKRETWRAEIYVPRSGAEMAHRDRGSVCIRGPNRFALEEAEDDLEQFKR